MGGCSYLAVVLEPDGRPVRLRQIAAAALPHQGPARGPPPKLAGNHCRFVCPLDHCGGVNGRMARSRVSAFAFDEQRCFGFHGIVAFLSLSWPYELVHWSGVQFCIATLVFNSCCLSHQHLRVVPAWVGTTCHEGSNLQTENGLQRMGFAWPFTALGRAWGECFTPPGVCLWAPPAGLRPQKLMTVFCGKFFRSD